MGLSRLSSKVSMSQLQATADPMPRSDIDPFADDVLLDPFPAQAQLRDLGPVVLLERYGVYAIARHAEVSAALNDWATVLIGPRRRHR